MSLATHEMRRLPARSPRRARRFDIVREAAEHPAADVGESELVARLRAGDDQAYETVVRTYGPRMFAVARGYLHSQEDAEDALQSAFLLVLRFIHRFEGSSRLSTWLHRIVVNCALMRIRARNRHPEAHLDVAAVEDESAPAPAAHARFSVADELVRRETHDQLLRSVGRLPDKVRAAVRLRDVDELSLGETSRLLGRSLTSVKTSVHRGRVALRAMLAPDGASLRAFERGEPSFPRVSRAFPPPRSGSELRETAGASRS